MLPVRRRETESIVSATKLYAGHTWRLNDWPLLFDCYYSNGVKSGEFEFIDERDCKCKLKLQPYNGSTNNATILIEFKGTIDCIALEVVVSLVDDEMIKLHTVSSVYEGPISNKLKMNFGRSIFDKSSEYIRKNTIMVRTEFTVVKSIDHSSNADSFDGHITKSVHNNLVELLASQEFCDVTFVIGEKKFLAHKIILAANSEVFKAMFATEMKEAEESVVKIEEVEADVFEEFIRYMYSRNINNLQPIADKLIFVANMYLVDDLKQLCEDYMIVHLNVQNAIQYLLAAYKLECKFLKAKTVQFIKANTHVLANAANFKILSNYPELIEEVFGK